MFIGTEDGKMKKKGLAVIYDPHNLYQFVWYYCNKGKAKKWDALCLPNGYKGEYMHTFCEDVGIFQKIYRNDTDFSILPASDKLKTFAKMFLYFIAGRKTAYCKKLINQYVNEEDYDEFVVIADVGIVSGACVALGKEKKVIILEDGINDYGRRQILIPISKLKSGYAWQGFILSLMGYCSPGWYRLKTDQNCIKYCSQPEKMKYKGYKELRQLYTDEGTDIKLFDSLLRKIYPGLNNYNFDDVDVILFTRPLDDFVKDYEKYKRRIEDYISGQYKTVVIKKHPREHGEYQFGKGVKSIEIDNAIPAEVLLPFIRGKDIVIITTSSIMLYMKAYSLHCKVMIFNGMYEESVKDNSRKISPTFMEVKSFADSFCEYYEIVQN